MATNHETLLRQWTMLRMIPRHPHKITARDLTERLEAEDFAVSKRTVERDLMDLSVAFPLALDDREKPYGWSWQKDAPSFDLPGLGNHEALALAMLEAHLANLLPASTVDVLAPYFKAARQHLERIPVARHAHSWLDKVRSVPANQPLLPPEIQSEVQSTVTDALLAERQLLVRYRRKGETNEVEYRISPLAMVQRGAVVYLYVRINEYEDTRLLVLHRIMSATMLDEPVRYPADFNIDHEIAAGRFGFGNGDLIAFKAAFIAESAEHLYETPLSRDQVIEEMPDGRMMVTATVADTPQLRWWLLGIGDGVEVFAPVSLRNEIATTIHSMVESYQ